ncbi:MAG: epoxyqueuosine reductase [Clostridia bacterium]|nr:epoxyqueuosine reductase [Clostridia bacterium]
MTVNERLSRFFDSENIEYWGVLDYAMAKEINPHIANRAGFVPKSIIMYLIPYFVSEGENLSAYATSRDYHLIISELNERLSRVVSDMFPNSQIRGYGDHSPIDERGAALSLGLGILGENGLLINEKYGSYIFIADLVTSVEPSELSAIEPKEVLHCIGCKKCLAACPTGILSGDGCDCLSSITQRKGELLDFEVELMRKFNTVWGCDECQRCCPYNENPIATPISFFHRDRVKRLTPRALSAMSDEEFSTRAFAWRKRATVERNLSYFEFAEDEK